MASAELAAAPLLLDPAPNSSCKINTWRKKREIIARIEMCILGDRVYKRRHEMRKGIMTRKRR
jgi:hypothetical protein